MGVAETNISKDIQVRAARMGTVLFRNNRGLFWTLDLERKIRAGLEAKGSSDLIGLTKVRITQSMVGKELPVFTAIEVKTETGKASKEQEDFISFVKSVHGVSGVARNKDDFEKIIDAYKKEL